MASYSYSHPFYAKPTLDLALLPDGVREVIFSHLTYNAAAVACCVSRSWNSIFSTRARHLWSHLDFHHARFSVPITQDVVRGVLAKARDALVSLANVPEEHLHLLPGIVALSPALAFIHTSGTAACRPELALDMLQASQGGLLSLRVGLLSLWTDAMCKHATLQLLTHPAVAVERLEVRSSVYGQENSADKMLASASVAMHAQAAHLEAVTVRWEMNQIPDHDDRDEEDDGYHYLFWPRPRAPDAAEGTLAFTAAVAACPLLRVVNVPSLLHAGVFANVAEAMAPRVHGSLTLDDPEDVAHYLPGVARHFLSRLTSLTVNSTLTNTPVLLDPPLCDAFAQLGASLRELGAAAPLRRLVLSMTGSVSTLEAEQFFDGLATTSITELEVHSGLRQTLQSSAQPFEHLGVLAASGLPPTLERLTIVGELKEGDMAPIIRAVESVSTLRHLTFLECNWFDTQNEAVLAAHLASPACTLRSLDLQGCVFGTYDMHGCHSYMPGSMRFLAGALWANTSLRELSVLPVTGDVALSLASALPGARLVALTVHLHSLELDPYRHYDCTLAHVEALANTVRNSATMRRLRVVAKAWRTKECVLREAHHILSGAVNAQGRTHVAWLEASSS